MSEKSINITSFYILTLYVVLFTKCNNLTNNQPTKANIVQV